MAHRFSRKSAALAAGLTCLLTAAALTANADEVGWVLANQPNAVRIYTPASQYSFNSTTATPANTVQNTNGKGTYFVDFPNLGQEAVNGAPDDVQVSGYNMTGWCLSMGWSSDPTEVGVKVQCYDSSGKEANGSFTVFYQARSALFGNAKQGLAYLLNSQLTGTSSYAPVRSFNSTGGANMIKYNKTGNYTATLPGLTKFSGNVQVSVEVLRNQQCKAASWTVGSAGANVTVQCYNFVGAPVNAVFTLAYAVGEPFGLVTGSSTRGAWAWAGRLADTSVYTPDAAYQYSGFGTGPMTVQRTGVGRYTATIPGTVSYTSSVALVTAVGGGGAHCNVAGWAGAKVYVACFHSNGTPADSQFDVTLQSLGS